jgi:uncharacterized cupin superfamily protein
MGNLRIFNCFPERLEAGRVNDNSRRGFLGSLGSFALVPMMGISANEPAQSDAARPAEGDGLEMVKLDSVACPSWPLQSLGAAIVQGHPEAGGNTVFESKDHQITSGVWTCSPGSFDLTFTWDEMALLLEGELIIEEASGKKFRLLPGDCFSIPRGVRTRWVVVKAMKKLFFSRERA